MFVIMACWDDLSITQKQLPLHERIGLMLKHAGVSITVTSVTDVLAFIVGSSTVSINNISHIVVRLFNFLINHTLIYADVTLH